MARRPFELTGAEWAIMRSVWCHEPCAAPTVQESLEAERGWSYSTVKTIMDRLADKGHLRTERIRNLILYRSTMSRTEAQRAEVRRAVRRAFNGALPPLMQFLLGDSDFTEAELAELESLIQEKRNARPRKPRSRGML